jgi:hypothetical protein
MNPHHQSSGQATPYSTLWCLCFLYTASVAIAIQFLVLPYLLPQWHAGNGLLRGGDWLTLHNLAVELAQKISTQGWSAWTLRKDEQFPSSIAAAIYALSVPEPWTLIPLNAALHATAAILLLRIMQIFLKPWRQAVWTVLPLLLYPSAAMWYAQIHKEGYAICGFLLFLLGFLLLAEAGYKAVRTQTISKAVFFIALGIALSLLVRPYVMGVFRMLGIPSAILLLAIALIGAGKGKRRWHTSSALVFVILLLVIPYGEKIERSIIKRIPQDGPPSTSSCLPQGTNTFQLKWEPSPWLPANLDSKLYSLSFTRGKYLWLCTEGKSALDQDVAFGSAGEVLSYLPRALQIGLFSPFPDQWFSEGSQPENTVMRRVAAFEMTGVYLAMPFLIYAIWQWRRNTELWLMLWFCLGMLVVHALTIPNAGSLYRVRYGYLMPLVALGIAGAVSIWERFHKNCNSPPERTSGD